MLLWGGNEIEEMGLFYLIKIGENKYMDKLYMRGLIHMKNIDWFRKYEDKKIRGDKDEGINGIEQIAELKLLLPDGKVLGRSNSAQLKFHDYGKKGNLYSMIAITSREDPEKFRIDERNKELGDCFVVIINVEEFIKRIEKKLNELGYEYEYSLVNYYDSKSYHGTLNVFCKPIEFNYQKEFRFWVRRNEAETLEFEIGSIEDIALIYDIEKLDKISIKHIKK